MGLVRGVMATVLFFLGVSVATAQDSDAERLKKLEETVQKQQKEIDDLKKSPPADKAAGGGMTGSLEDGFRYKTADGNLDLHVGGRFQIDF